MIHIINYIILISSLVLLAYIDFKKKIIPNKILLVMLVLRLILIGIEGLLYRDMINSILISSFLGLIVGGGAFLLVSFIHKNSVGMGDIKLVAIIGFYVGIGNLFSCVISSLLISLICGIVLILAKKINKKDLIPFAPFLMLGTFLTLVFSL
jgi:leader peptidase (prepilin peptidase)/N-methyltransferase